MAKFDISSRRWWVVLSWILVTASLFAQTPAADGGDPEQLRKAAQNPVAKSDERAHPGKLEFQYRPEQPHAEYIEYSAGDSSEPWKGLEPDRSLDDLSSFSPIFRRLKLVSMALAMY